MALACSGLVYPRANAARPFQGCGSHSTPKALRAPYQGLVRVERGAGLAGGLGFGAEGVLGLERSSFASTLPILLIAVACVSVSWAGSALAGVTAVAFVVAGLVEGFCCFG